MPERLSGMELMFWVGQFRQPLAMAIIPGHSIPPVAFKLTAARLIASELASVRCHRLAWALARTVSAVEIIWISELMGVELMSFYL